MTQASPTQPMTPRAGPRNDGRAGGFEVALLAAWDLLVALIVLLSTNAFGTGLRGASVRTAVGLLGILILSATGAYHRTSWLREHPVETVRQLALASTMLAWIGVLATVVLGLPQHMTALVIAWLVVPVGWYLGRRVATWLRRRAVPERLLILGSGEVARRVAELARRPGSASVVIGCLDDDPGPMDREDPPLLGGIDQLPHVLAVGRVDRVIVAFSSTRDFETLDALRSATAYRGPIDIVPRFFDFVGPHAITYNADGMAFVSIPARRVTRGRAILKRAIDLVGSIGLLIVLSPLMLAIAFTILIDSGRPVLFRQRRIGMHGSTFEILKFRTLRPEPPAPPGIDALELTPGSIGVHVEQAKQEAAKRATRSGAFLRKTSLDELPNLFNVVRGQMSLVGPRPLSPLEDAVLDGWELLRRDMRPGITGLWQVSGRSEISWEHRINLDYRQVRHWSLTADLHTLTDTIRAVLHRRGAE
jgi:exopolysaccharide biosynthesis polyprenyl glycosylphosphotransferase